MKELFEWKKQTVMSVASERRTRLRNIKVTERNASEVPIDWLQVRYYRLKRWIEESQNAKEEWANELKVIEAELASRNRLELIQEQEVVQLELEGIPSITREEYVSIVEERLRVHYQMCKEYAWLHEQRAATQAVDRQTVYSHRQLGLGVTLIHDEQQDKLHDRLMQLQENILHIRTILETRLTEEQRLLIKEKYLTREMPKDDYLMLKLHVGRQKYYNLKKQALTRIAYELGVI